MINKYNYDGDINNLFEFIYSIFNKKNMEIVCKELYLFPKNNNLKK